MSQELRNPFSKLTLYSTNHLLSHLREIGQAKAIHRLLAVETADGLNAWHEHRTAQKSDMEYQGDLDLASALCKLSCTNKRLGQHLVLKTRYALISSSLSALHDLFPSNLVGRLVKEGIWTSGHALDSIEMMSDSTSKGSALKEILSHLGPEHFSRAVSIAKSLPSYGLRFFSDSDFYDQLLTSSTKAEILVILSSRIGGHQAHDLAHEAFKTIVGIKDKTHRALALVEIMPSTTGDVLNLVANEVLSIADKKDNPERRALTVAVVEHLPDRRDLISPRLNAVFGQDSKYRERNSDSLLGSISALRKVPQDVLLDATQVLLARTANTRARGLLEAVAPYLDQSSTSSVLRELKIKSCSKSVTLELVPIFARHVELSGKQEFDVIYRQLNDPGNRLAFYIAARRWLDSKTSQRIAIGLHEEVLRIKAVSARTHAAAWLSRDHYLPKKVRADLLRLAVRETMAIRNPNPRLNALWMLHEVLPNDEEIYTLLHSSILNQKNKVQKAEALLRLCSCGMVDHRSTLWDEALVVTRSVSKLRDRSKLLVTLAQLDPSRVVPLLSNLICSFSDKSVAVGSLAKLLPIIDVQMQAEVTEKIILLIRQSIDNKEKRRMLAKSADYFNRDALTRIATIFGQVADWKEQLDCLTEFVAQQPRQLDAILLDQLQSTGDRSDSAGEALARLAPVLTEGSARRAVSLVRKIRSPEVKAKSLSAYKQFLTRDEHDQVLRDALNVRHVASRCSALAAVIADIPFDLLVSQLESIESALPKSLHWRPDPESASVCVAVGRRMAEEERLDVAFEWMTKRPGTHAENLIEISHKLARDSKHFNNIIEQSVGSSQEIANTWLVLALLSWRAKLVSNHDALDIVFSLDKHAFPKVLSAVSYWLDDEQIRTVLRYVKARIVRRCVAAKPFSHTWDDEERQGLRSTFKMISGGSVYRRDDSPPEVGQVAAAVIPRLIALGHEADAFGYLHHVPSFRLGAVICASTPHLSKQGLRRIRDFALSIEHRELWQAAIVAVSIEFAKRGHWEEAWPLIEKLPKSVAQTPSFHRYQFAGALQRVRKVGNRPLFHALPAELTEVMLPDALANNPRIATLVCCLRFLPESKHHEVLGNIFELASTDSSNSLIVLGVSELLRGDEEFSKHLLVEIAAKMLGESRDLSATTRFKRASLLNRIKTIVPIYSALGEDTAIMQMYETIASVSRWWR